jgi:hypothetical protein
MDPEKYWMYGYNIQDWTISSQASSIRYARIKMKVQRLDGSGLVMIA